MSEKWDLPIFRLSWDCFGYWENDDAWSEPVDVLLPRPLVAEMMLACFWTERTRMPFNTGCLGTTLLEVTTVSVITVK